MILLALLLQAAPLPQPLPTFARGWAGAETVWSTGIDKKTLAVGWVEGQLGLGRVALSGSVGALGLVGKFQANLPDTYSALRLQAAVKWLPLSRPGFSCGPALGIEGGVPLEALDPAPRLYHQLTWGAGLACEGSGWSAYRVFGQDEQLHGWAMLGRTLVPMSDRISWVVRDSLGGQRRYTIKLDVVVRVF